MHPRLAPGQATACGPQRLQRGRAYMPDGAQCATIRGVQEFSAAQGQITRPDVPSVRVPAGGCRRVRALPAWHPCMQPTWTGTAATSAAVGGRAAVSNSTPSQLGRSRLHRASLCGSQDFTRRPDSRGQDARLGGQGLVAVHGLPLWRTAGVGRQDQQARPGGPFCAGTRPCRCWSLLAQRPDLMQQWDWDASAGLDPTQLAVGSANVVHWRCRQHGPACRWQAQVKCRIGCAACLPSWEPQLPMPACN